MKLTIVIILLSAALSFSCKKEKSNPETPELYPEKLAKEDNLEALSTREFANVEDSSTSTIVTKKSALDKADSLILVESKKVDSSPSQNKTRKESSKTQLASGKKVNRKSSVNKPRAEKKGKLQFIKKVFDFGFVEVGEVVNHKFKFVNTGSIPVSISNATASCGCTTPVFPFLEIEPGGTGEIGVRFNSKDRLGSQVATVTVYSDAENSEQELTIKGVVRSEIVSPSEIIDTLK